ncbi:sigma factor-like helix-turn-helix DNA-binding protein [Lactiplantibacillus plantarum]|uniref:RNA polymerase sigma factor n=1 Tax=Lactiplantibacillus plantarum TaxID=1590 RepID=UPI002B203705|nr:sigma factor-like helix-turn-helix DNA-binding protein [Lactiplantibacillus plantarum]MEA5158738.1 sigma factor-like helix-turn-helix DNA-binding protein [Lactiplantibacillus plantarum]
MSSEREVSKMFVRYMQRVLRNERINIYRKHLRDVKETPLEDWLLEEIVEPSHLSDFFLTEDEVAHLESFIENEHLATAVATLSTANKMVLYQYYYSELNDVEIGSRTGKTSQGVNKRRRRALARIKEAYRNAYI